MKESINFKVTPFQPIKEAAKSTGFSQFYLRQGVKAGAIPHIRSGNKIYINVPLFLQQMDIQSATNQAPPKTQ